MSLIRKKQELSLPHYIKAMIYGQVGSGKTTLALSAPRPLLLDFDGGIHRVNFGHVGDNTVQIKRWGEALSVLQEDLSDFDTIIVDTIGKMMDYIIEMAEQNRISGWKKWDFINDEFKKFIRTIDRLNKHIILIAHRDTRPEGDETVFVPSLREKNYTSIITELDLIGYISIVGVERTITFNPIKNDGKNTLHLPDMKIPVVVNQKREALPNTFFTDKILKPFKEDIQVKINYGKEYEALIEEIKSDITFIESEIEANAFLDKMKSLKHIGNSLAMSRKLFSDKVKELGLVLNADKRYEKPAA